MSKHCSFCKSKESVDNRLLAGDNIYICENCVISAYKIFFGEEEESSEQVDLNMELFTPKELKNFSGSNRLRRDNEK